MGIYLFDQYTYLHFASGIIFYYWGFSLKWVFILHTLFEIFENSSIGMKLINKYLIFWPGGKPYSDSFINIIGDTLGVILGWLSAYYLDYIGNSYNWYSKDTNKNI